MPCIIISFPILDDLKTVFKKRNWKYSEEPSKTQK